MPSPPQMKYKEVKIEPPRCCMLTVVWAVNVQKENRSAQTGRDFMVSWSRWTHRYISISTHSLTYTHIYTMTLFPSHNSDIYSLDGGEESKPRVKNSLQWFVRSFIQPTFIKNRLVTSGIALVLETDRQTRHGVCLWGALQEAGEQTRKSVITTPQDTGKKSSEHRYPRSSGWRCLAMWRGQKSSPQDVDLGLPLKDESC